jgi:hypothetical protein
LARVRHLPHQLLAKGRDFTRFGPQPNPNNLLLKAKGEGRSLGKEKWTKDEHFAYIQFIQDKRSEMEQTYEKIAKGLSQHVKNIKDPNS